MDDKLKLKIANSWLDDKTKIGMIPSDLKDQMTGDDLLNFIQEISGRTGMDRAGLIGYKSLLESEIREKRSHIREENNHKIQVWALYVGVGSLIIGIITLVFVGFSTFFDNSQEEGFNKLDGRFNELIGVSKSPIKNMTFKIDMWKLGQDEAKDICEYGGECVKVYEIPLYTKRSYYYFTVMPRSKEDFTIERVNMEVNCGLLTEVYLKSDVGEIKTKLDDLVFTVENFNNIDEPKLMFISSSYHEPKEEEEIPLVCDILYTIEDQPIASISVDVNYRGNNFPS
ncbi:hypothetical protein HY500_03335 [Candidatus Woesearchaeota archaeon]|nr:hypothetical protein [Candidatus Woesearchaeota archaeon]